jgi:ATP-dependent Clp protease protease subunit
VVGKGDLTETIAQLLRRRIICLGAEITDDLAQAIIAQLLYLDDQDPSAEIELRIVSAGGLVSASLAIHDAMQSLRAPVSTWAVGDAAGTATLLVAAGRPGRRFAASGARIVLVPCHASPTARASEHEVARADGEIRDLLARYTGRGAVIVAEAMERSVTLTASEARQFGIVDALRDR